MVVLYEEVGMGHMSDQVHALLRMGQILKLVYAGKAMLCLNVLWFIEGRVSVLRGVLP